MNVFEFDVLKHIYTKGFSNQRDIAKQLSISLGKINHTINSLINDGYLTAQVDITDKCLSFFDKCRPKNAIILAAGYGLRMVPINTEIPKGLLEVNGEPLIERLIKQLHKAGIQEIHIIVGYQKEKYEYLMDLYNVNLVVNMNYSTKNNLHSLTKVINKIGNSYILPCDLWCRENPFSQYEYYPWYIVSDRLSINSTIKVNRQRKLVPISANTEGNSMLGISYIPYNISDILKKQLSLFSKQSSYDDSFWEDALFELPRTDIYAKVVADKNIIEINTFEQLRNIDHNSENLHSSAMQIIVDTFHTSIDEIKQIETLKKGMTNRSFLFTFNKERYIMRIPGEGTDMLINRAKEADVYKQLNGLNICDDIIYMNPQNGYKITKYLENTHTCDPENDSDIRLCMKKLKEFHQKRLTVNHTFDIFHQIDYYEHLWNRNTSMYKDYVMTREHVFSLVSYIDSQPKEYVLTHIDAVPDNFLIIENSDRSSLLDIRLIDWEYAGMQDPHVDIAMFCIYSLYSREQVDHLIDLYFDYNCSAKTRIKIYCYIASCGLLWSNWCEYKSTLGIEFGEYALRQYRYAKDYYKIAISEMEKLDNV